MTIKAYEYEEYSYDLFVHGASRATFLYSLICCYTIKKDDNDYLS